MVWSLTINLESETTNLESETTNPEQNSAPERSGWALESKNATTCTNIHDKWSENLKKLKVQKWILRI